MPIIVVGLSHRTAPVELREKFSLAGCGLGMALEDLRALGIEGVVFPEAVILSTCNRLEIYAVADDVDRGWKQLEAFLGHLQGIDAAALTPHLYRLKDSEATQHLMRVACGLDSLILGEHQI